MVRSCERVLDHKPRSETPPGAIIVDALLNGYERLARQFGHALATSVLTSGRCNRAGSFFLPTRPRFHHGRTDGDTEILAHSFGVIFNFFQHRSDKLHIAYFLRDAGKIDR